MKSHKSIESIDKLLPSKTYWYVTVGECCHWDELSVKKYECEGKSKDPKLKPLHGQIFFESYEEAIAFQNDLRSLISPYIIQYSTDE